MCKQTHIKFLLTFVQIKFVAATFHLMRLLQNAIDPQQLKCMHEIVLRSYTSSSQIKQIEQQQHTAAAKAEIYLPKYELTRRSELKRLRYVDYVSHAALQTTPSLNQL